MPNIQPVTGVRHSVDFGFRVAVMTQIISCQELLAQIFSKPLPPPTRDSTVASCQLPQLVNAFQE